MSVSVHPCTVAIQAYSILQYTKKLGSTGVALIYVAQKWLFKLTYTKKLCNTEVAMQAYTRDGFTITI